VLVSRLPSISDSRGFTLAELVVAMALGMIVLLAAFTVIDRAFTTNKAVSDREDALQRGRIALEQMTRQIRSMTCAGAPHGRFRHTTPALPGIRVGTAAGARRCRHQHAGTANLPTAAGVG
jgi:Tfp pilus assembly protein PilW